MTMTVGSPEPLSVDLSAVSSDAARKDVLKAIENIGRSPRAGLHYWAQFGKGQSKKSRGQTLVVADLHRVASFFATTEPHLWVAALRQTRSFILACVRTKRDLDYAEVVDDIMRFSESRFAVCEFGSRPSHSLHWVKFESCLSKAVAALDPDALIDVRYAKPDGNLWVEFGDGLAGSVKPKDLLGGDHDLRLDTAVVSFEFDAIELLDSNDTVFHVDASSVRAAVDESYATEVLNPEANRSRATLGETLRQFRVSQGVTQSELAKTSGLEQALISKLERGKHQPRYDTLQKYAIGLGVSVPDLLSQASHGA